MGIYCRQCDYSLAGLGAGGCPECGRAFDPANRRTFAAAPKAQAYLRWGLIVQSLGMALVVGTLVAWVHATFAVPMLERATVVNSVSLTPISVKWLAACRDLRSHGALPTRGIILGLTGVALWAAGTAGGRACRQRLGARLHLLRLSNWILGVVLLLVLAAASLGAFPIGLSVSHLLSAPRPGASAHAVINNLFLASFGLSLGSAALVLCLCWFGHLCARQGPGAGTDRESFDVAK
ncbi:MAG: hypothetical protein CMJ18_18715 [Phycisphaeraceae bacterium]|nr:hypothetical protein [Phycisphaeraceae bacterium]